MGDDRSPVPGEPLSASHVRGDRLRLCAVAPVGRTAPTTYGAQDTNTLEEVLPISASPRDRLLAGEEHDERGYHLSRELKRELGDRER